MWLLQMVTSAVLGALGRLFSCGGGQGCSLLDQKDQMYTLRLDVTLIGWIECFATNGTVHSLKEVRHCPLFPCGSFEQ